LAIGRRRKSAFVAAPLIGGLAFLGTEVQAQEINGQTLKPAIGEDDFFAIDDSAVGPERFGGALLYNHARDPLVWRYPSGATQSILETVHTLDVQAWGVVGPVRIGLDVPFNLGVQGLGIAEGEAGVTGDIRLDARWELLERGASPVGVAVLGGVQTPTGDGEAFVGEPAWSGTLRGALTAGNADRFVALNMGFLFTEKELLPDDAVFGSRFTWGLGGTLPLIGPVAGSAELVGARFLGSAGGAAATPLEGLLSLRGQLPEGVVLSAGTGFGLTEGMGAPRYRILAGIQGHFGSSVADEAGILDAAPGRTPTSLEFIAEDGARISEAIFTLESGPQTAQLNTPHDSALIVHLKPGIYGFSVEAAGFEPITGVMEVPVAASHEQRIAMARVKGGCNVTVRVTDTQEAPVAAVVAASRGGQKADTQAEATNGIARFQISPGEAWELIISSPGYSTEHRAVACSRGADGQLANVEKEVVLVAPRARLEGSRVIIMDKVNFALDQDRILAEGKGVLDDVAKVLKEHPEIRRMEIQGHTDLRGPAGYNLTLSQRRAEQVKRYLVSVHGVEADRLTAKGYGESAPMIAASDKEADEANRRVEFHVIEQD
jgi:outer membrane protein OmpA-like peptidoglycan-associated protein